MKHISIQVISLLLLTAAISAQAPQEARLEIRANTGKVPLNDASSKTGSVSHPSWLKPGEKEASLTATYKLVPNKWTAIDITFTPAGNGAAILQLMGPYYKKQGETALTPVYIRWDGITAEGSVINNGDFEDEDSAKPDTPKGWWKGGADAYIETAPGMVKNGKRSIAAWHNASFQTTLPLTENTVTVRAWVFFESKEEKPSVGTGDTFILTRKNLFPVDTSFETGAGCFPGADHDTRTGVHGRSSVMLTPPLMRSSKFFDVLYPDEKYTMTFSAKSETPTKARVVLWNLEYGWISSADLDLSADWKQCSVKVPPQKTRSGMYIEFRDFSSKIWLDALQLDKGDAKPYKPEPLSMSVDPVGPGNVVRTGNDALAMTVRMYNDSINTANVIVRFRTEAFDGSIAAQGETAVSLSKGGLTEPVIKALPVKNPGYYVTTITAFDGAKELKRFTVPFCVIASPPPLEQDSFFGIHPGAMPKQWLSNIGMVWQRNFPSWKWQYRSSDAPIDLSFIDKDTASGLLPYYTFKIAEMPDWIKKKGLDYKQEYVSYMKKVVEGYKDKVNIWELENEPDLEFKKMLGKDAVTAAREYAEVLAAAAKAIREIDPSAKISGASVSGGDPDDHFIFMKEVFRLAGNSMDIVSPHIYSSPRTIGPEAMGAKSPEDNRFREKLIEVKQIIDQYGGKQDVWMGEVGWELDVRTAYNDSYARTYSEYLVRAHLASLSLPFMKKFFWFTAEGCHEKKNYSYGMWRDPYAPLPAVAAYANMTRLFYKAVPREPILDTEIKIFPFVREITKPLAAVWKYKGESGDMYLDVKPSAVLVTDMVGAAYTPEVRNGKLRIPLTTSPLYITSDILSYDAFAAVLRGAEIRVKPAVVFRNRFANSYEFTLKNNTAAELSLAASVSGVSVENPSRNIAVPANGNSVLSFTGAFTAAGTNRITLTLEQPPDVTKKTYTLSYLSCLRKAVAISSAADRSEFDGLPAIIITTKENILPPDPTVGWKGPDDLSIEANTAWDDAALYLCLSVTDDVHDQKNAPANMWKADSVQLGIDAENDASDSGGYDGNDFEFGFALTESGPRTWCWTAPVKELLGSPAGVVCNVNRDGNKTVYKIALPWKVLSPLEGKPNRTFGMNFTVNDSDGAGRKYWMGLTPGIAEGKTPALFRKFVLIEK
ncbi:MAG: hypothetical protein HZC28_13625 [Spirochaetes bacterium]|nr:hypothetical protein [Spirochaetota bacterium]